MNDDKNEKLTETLDDRELRRIVIQRLSGDDAAVEVELEDL